MKNSTRKAKNSKVSKNINDFKAIYSDVAGIDIGAKSIFVAVPTDDGTCVKSFNTLTTDLKAIAEWLQESKIKSAAMEATGVYWIPLFEILADTGIEPILVDSKTVKNVPGKKTDVLDCQWIQKLFSCGLLSPAFRPFKEKESFRAYLRHRDNIVKARQKIILQMQKALLLMNIKLDVAVSDIASVSGMAIIRAIVAGERDPNKLASLRNYRCRKEEKVFVSALTGNFQETHLFSLKQGLASYDFLGNQMKECDEQILRELEKWKTVTNAPLPKPDIEKSKDHPNYAHARKHKKNEFHFDMRTILYQKTGIDLMAVPSLGEHTIAVVLSELGGVEGLQAFKSEHHFSSWVKVCPGNNVSGGRNFGGHGRKSSNRIKRALCMAAMSLSHSKCALGECYRRLAARIGKAQAIKAIAHKLAKLIYRMLTQGMDYVEQEQQKREQKRQERRIKQLENMAKDLNYMLVKAA